MKRLNLHGNFSSSFSEVLPRRTLWEDYSADVIRTLRAGVLNEFVELSAMKLDALM